MRLKFQIAIDLKQAVDLNRGPLETLLLDKVHELYRQKEIEFPITVAIARFMSEATRQMGGPGAHYDRDGLLRWYQARFAGIQPAISEEDFRTQSRNKLHQMLLEVSRNSFPPAGQDQIDAMLGETFEGTHVSEDEDAHEMVAWAQANIGIEIDQGLLTGISADQAATCSGTPSTNVIAPK